MHYHVIPYNDEILYSQIARFLDHTIEKKAQSGLIRLFGNGKVKATIDLPNHLDALYANYYYQIEGSVANIIGKYTLYPFYEPFLRMNKRCRILDNLKSGSGSLIHVIAGINSSKISRNRYPRYCPQCIMESRSRFHEAYWHRVHQLPGVLVCPFHNVLVSEYKPTLSQLNDSMFIAAECLSSHSIVNIENRNSTLLKISKMLDDVLNQRSDFDINTVDYKNMIQGSSYMRGSCINYISLIEKMKHYYGIDTLNEYFPDYKHPLQWVPSLVRRPTKYFEPIKHILLFNFIGELENRPQLFETEEWKGPWKCINGACGHYGKYRIRNADVFYDYTLKRTAAIVKCKCGLIYKVSYRIKKGIRTESISVKDYGDLWRKSVLEFKHAGKSVSSIAILMGCGFRVVSKFIKSENDVELKNKDLRFQNDLVVKREEWKRLLDSYSESKIVSARRANNRLYKWLYNNDLAWLKIINKLNAREFKPDGLKLNWEKIDNELISKIATTFEDLRRRKFKGRITKSIISKLINKENNYLRINSAKIPNSSAFLEKLVESKEAFQKRRLKSSLKELRRNGESLTVSKVIRNSRLKKVDDHNLIQFLEDELNKSLCA